MKDISKTNLADIELNHHIQRQILKHFLHSDSCSYTELLVDGMSGNSFIYHLKALIREKLIEKSTSQAYVITPFGKLVLDNLAFDSSRFLLRPAIGVFVLARSKDGKYMLYRSARQPLIGKVSCLFSKITIGSSYTSSIEWVTSRRGIDHFSIASTANVSIIYRINGEIVSHRVGMLAVIDTEVSMPDRTTDAGTTLWLSKSELANTLPEVDALINAENGTFIELDLELV